ncbi:gluconokinase [Herbiconiux sp. VKM Ac-1786]|uniref:gluconokinase n=1 Tax=Herbiconiux sp. VKM Ac-1786 TaxID=2783824 RepID=UPI00188C05DB|nr:gluconokinase [Herbiconiux sp. VKM Ac-1786]MBF4572352.1 gluconokinase [Herbiconiux sp. VKM Ac-1786]
MRNRVVFTTGVSGSGKSTIGVLLADRLGWAFVDADDLHPEANVEKMAAGIPLTDDDRWPWLRAVGAAAASGVEQADAAGTAGTSGEPAGVVVACSALRRVYRDVLREADPGAVFVQLVGSAELIGDRLRARQHHFMPATLLGSQLATLEPLGADEAGLAVVVSAGPETVVAEIISGLTLT